MGHRFECFLQHDSMQCGIACLAMICKHYGKEFSIETLSRYCFASTEGVSLLGISEAANKLGLHSVCGRVSMEQIQQAPLPCILHWNQNHFVVLYQMINMKLSARSVFRDIPTTTICILSARKGYIYL